MLSKIPQCTQPLKGANGPFPSAKSQQSRIASKLPATVTTASSSSKSSPSSSAGYITISDPSNAHLTRATTAAQAMRAKRGGSIKALPPNGSGNGSGNGHGNGRGNGRGFTLTHSDPTPPEEEPLDEDIISILEHSQTVHIALVLLRSEVLLWAQRAYNGKTFTGDFDRQIRQLARVIEELKRTGQCIIKGKSVRPRDDD
ncbi:hypothetical protein GJ744_009204 [Endocarpon pusillum]|uniref:Uncharacterized protein n=1 Tax=Endocarpon pusillum TaxID=364733 RepID=A0A8H7AK42_9EURO|nr:hypothetical protein GJ744_009204 [Endocarpon pusillum]